MKYDKSKNFDEAERQLKAKQNIEPDIRNYYDPKGGWFNASYNSKREASSAYKIAQRNYKSKKKKK